MFVLSLCVLRSHEQKNVKRERKERERKQTFAFGGVQKEKKAEKAMELVKGAADLNAVASAWEEQIQNVGDLQFSSLCHRRVGPCMSVT